MNSSKKDLERSLLYEGVKSLVELEAKHIHLPQQKLFTLFSLSFQYFLFYSTKHPGHYIIRIEDGGLAEKLSQKAKDPSTRKFMQKLLIPRRLVYQNSHFHLDYFHVNSWTMTKDIPPHKLQGAIIVKNTSQAPMESTAPESEDLSATETIMDKNFYLNSLIQTCPKTITIAFGDPISDLKCHLFPFIQVKETLPKNVQIFDEDQLFDET